MGEENRREQVYPPSDQTARDQSVPLPRRVTVTPLTAISREAG